jgi:PiT family inorganic phosphate transporter
MGLGLLVTGIFLTILAPRVFHSSLAITFGVGCVGTMIIVGVIDQNFRTHDTIELEPTFAKLQIVSACFVAFAHGSNDVGNAIAPLAVIINARHLDQFTIPIWLLLLGGLGLVAGLAVQGKKVITTVGEKIIAIKPSQGFAAELSTATVILVASRFGFPVSTSHALVGAVAGIGFTQTDQSDQSVDGNVLKGVLGAWAITLPVGFIGANLIYKLLNVFW